MNSCHGQNAFFVVFAFVFFLFTFSIQTAVNFQPENKAPDFRKDWLFNEVLMGKGASRLLKVFNLKIDLCLSLFIFPFVFGHFNLL